MKRQRDYTTLSSISSGLDKVRWQNDYKFSACCPAHDDRNPSFSAKDDNGKILVKCFSGCTQDEVINALRDLGLWYSGSNAKINVSRSRTIKKSIQYHQFILAFGVNQVNQGQELSKLDRDQLKDSIEFLKVYANG